MTSEEVIEKLQGVFDKVFLDPVNVIPSLSAADVPEWDSMTHISLVVAVEKAFGVRFRIGEVGRAKNVGDFVNLILKRLDEKGG